MDSQVMFLDCPAYMDKQGTVRCGLPAQVRSRYIMNSTDGPLESVMIRCPSGHVFNGPVDSLTFDKREAQPDSSTELRRAAARRET
jgi:hypothetical protein